MQTFTEEKGQEKTSSRAASSSHEVPVPGSTCTALAEPGFSGQLFPPPPGRTGEDAAEQPVEPAARSIWPIFRAWQRVPD
eukprot:444646-Amphidinium_carterae.1